MSHPSFAASSYPILTITEIAEDGQVKGLYWQDLEEIYSLRDLWIEEAVGTIRFRMVRGSRDVALDALSAKRSKWSLLPVKRLP